MTQMEPRIEKQTYFSGVFAVVILVMGIICIGSKTSAKT
jgi:hypothetical protein